MALYQPDILQHNNPNLAISDSDFVKGGFRTAVATVNDLYSLSGKTDLPSADGQVKEYATIVYVSGETKYYVLKDVTNIGNISGWTEFVTGGGAGTVTGATNGLHLVSTGTTSVALGGTLTTGTTINASGQTFNVINIADIDGFQVKTSGDSTIFGVDKTGFLFSFSGGSVSFDDGGGLKYATTGYSSGYTATSIPDVHFVTGLTSGITGSYLKLDQTIPQNVIGSQPVFDEGIRFGTTPSPSQISGHTVGRAYYDTNYETISINIGTDTGHQPNIQLGQEMYRYVYNASGVPILNGAVVKQLGVHTGGPGTDVPTVAMAIASGTTNDVLGVATEDFAVNSYGFVTTIGYIHDIDTSTGQYSGMTTGDHIYLSPTVLGGITNVEPSSPNKAIHVGMLITKDVTVGKIYIDIHPALSLNDLLDVSVPAPTLNYVLTWNGADWVDAAAGSTSAGSGVNFYYATPVINSITGDAGISEDGTEGNGIQVATFSQTPVTSGATLLVAGIGDNDTRAFAAWGQDDEIGRTTIDSGLWEFYDYVSVDTLQDETYLIHGIYQVVDITGSTITTTGTGILRTATITNSGFTGTYFNASAINTEASYLQTPSGVFQISAVTDSNNVIIVTPAVSGYTNESGVSGSTWNPLFTGSTESIENVEPLYQTKIIATSFSVAETDRLGQILYVSTNASVGGRTLTLGYNGSSAASFVITPFITLHNDLPGLQGGTGTERYHSSLAEYTVLQNTSNTNTGDETKATIESKLTGTITTHNHYYSGLTGKPNLSVYQTVSGFTGYTASTAPVINNALTGVTYVGSGTTLYSGTTGLSGRTIVFNTIIGTGGTTVQKVGNEIIVSSLDAIGGQQYSGETPSAVDLCGISIGYELTGKTVSCIIQDLLVPELFQTTVTAPTRSINLSPSTTIYEIGCVIPTFDVIGGFNCGAQTPAYCGCSPYRTGPANTYCFSGSQIAGSYACTTATATQTVTSYTVLSGSINTWGVCVAYDAGECPVGSKGTPNSAVACCPAATTAAITTTFTGILPWFWGTSASSTITGADVTGGTKTLATVGTSTPITFNATTEYLWFAAPQGTYTTKTKWWVCSANAGNIGGVDQLWAASCSQNVTCGTKWVACPFDVYVTCGITTTAVGIPMCLYS